MSGYSSRHETVVAAVNFSGITALIEIVSAATLREEQFIRARYIERATHFDETLEFLSSIGLIESAGGQIKLASDVGGGDQVTAPSPPLRTALLQQIIASPTEYRLTLAHYLSGFRVEDDRIEFRPDAETQLNYSGIRDLLMEMNAIKYSQATGAYTVNPEYADVYLWAKNVTGPRTTAGEIAAAKRRREFGTSVEEAVVEFERRRVGPQFARRVEHVSAANPFACFDVGSVTITDTEIIPRFIEVKGVPRSSYEFFWTAKEIEAASLLRDRYFVYLIPVMQQKILDLDNLLMIGNAYETVLHSQDWEVEENVVWCRKRPVGSSESTNNRVLE